MKSFYSILKLSPNIATEDSVAIGVLLFDGKKFRCFFSDRKKRLAKKLIDDKNVNVDFIVNQIIDKCNTVNSDNEELKLFYKFDKFSNISYFDYLSSYSNGLIQFSKPNSIYEEMNDIAFERLINFLFNEPVQKYHTVLPNVLSFSRTIIEKKLINKVDKKVHTHYKFKPEVFPSIYFNYEMDCIGLNGSLIGAKSLAFDKSAQSLDKDISHYFALISSLSSKYDKPLKDNNFYLICEEPEKIDTKEHKLWESVRYNELISVIHPEESDKVADQIFEKKAAKFLTEL
ncbi:DUF3037 domain-containing protein [Leeuwenhoekiella marinoflava]|uniref:DUF3037 family protein n=2 Tax=Leeuwenhoekiella marinoflava TaxID=988 RepID=A0A4Q0PMG7_9FLAO|nr:DUF3037 domain-containing protein [Leeuwenhoekiella marinoflava]RXG29894.1 hypothetical protein DSL99_1947 [Leeuwenhoekiella marinoflava]SHF27053.1 Protein of unknown function [Leeuwenhoekiella marinoflava DSM 3653]